MRRASIIAQKGGTPNRNKRFRGKAVYAVMPQTPEGLACLPQEAADLGIIGVYAHPGPADQTELGAR